MADNWRLFRKAVDFHERYGYAAVLKAHLERWLGQPEKLVDLEEGVSRDTRRSYHRDEIPDNAEFPFERGGRTRDIFFYHPSGGAVSRLFRKSELNTDPNYLLSQFGFVIIIYEKMYATLNDTTMHFTSDQAFERYIGRPPGRSIWASKGYYDVLADPKGCPDAGTSKVAHRGQDLEEAIRKAEELEKKFSIRFLVGKIVSVHDAH